MNRDGGERIVLCVVCARVTPRADQPLVFAKLINGGVTVSIWQLMSAHQQGSERGVVMEGRPAGNEGGWEDENEGREMRWREGV